MSVLLDLGEHLRWLIVPEADLTEAEAQERATTFMRTVAEPALQTVREELASVGYDPAIEHAEGEVALTVPRTDGSSFRFAVAPEIFHKMGFAFPALHGKKHRPRHVRIVLTSPSRTRYRRPSRLDQETLVELCRRSARKWLDW